MPFCVVPFSLFPFDAEGAKLSVTVFTTGPSCHLCRVTKVHMQRRGIAFDEVRLDEHPALAKKVRELGFVSAPVVLVDDEDCWEGYSSDRIDALAAELTVPAA